MYVRAQTEDSIVNILLMAIPNCLMNGLAIDYWSQPFRSSTITVNFVS
jgi:hypothetical protein